MPLNTLDAKSYISTRLDKERDWYDRKAAVSKKWFQLQQTCAAIAAAIVPALINITLIPAPYREWLATLVSVGVAVLVGIEKVHHFGDQWRNYRSTEQFLTREKILFLAGQGPYKEKDPKSALSLLIDRCESQLAAENSATLNVIAISAQQPEGHGASGTVVPLSTERG